MDIENLDLYAFAVEKFDCPYCQQPAILPCVTKSGAVARYTHWARVAPLHEAWRSGFWTGHNEAYRLAKSQPAHFARQVAKHDG